MSGIVTATISKIEAGTKKVTQLNSKYSLMSIDLIKSVNHIPSAEIVVVDGDAAQQKFELSDSEFFQPGSKISIKLRYENEDTDSLVFVGYVIKHGLQAHHSNSTLTLYLKDAAIKLTQGRNNAIFRDQHDMAIMQGLIKAAIARDNKRNIEDLTLGPCKPTKTSMAHPEMVQFYCSDWDFILARAAANGLWVMVEEGIISIQAPNTLARKTVELEYGRDEILEFDVEADIRQQYASIEAIAWDAENQKLTPPQKSADYSLKQKNLKPATLGPLIGADKFQLISGANLAPNELKDWASAKMSQHRLGLLKGHIQIIGNATLNLGDTLKLTKFGNRFSGQALITGVRHQVSEIGWYTDIQFGLSSVSYAPSDDVIAPPANQLLPAVSGLQIGVVGDQVNPDDALKVQVKLPRLTPTLATQKSDQQDGCVWARLATLEAGRSSGTLFRPEADDEVILGFLNDDPREPVILGALHNKVNKPPLPPSKDNFQRGIVTKEKLKVIFDDKEKSIRLETPNTNRIILIDEDGAIYIEDENNNKFKMNSDGIQISSDKNIAIKSKGKVTLKGSNIDVK